MLVILQFEHFKVSNVSGLSAVVILKLRIQISVPASRLHGLELGFRI